MVKDSIKSLHEKCQVSMAKWSDQPWTFLQIRKVSIYITWLFLQTSIKPNTMTLFGLSCSFAAAIALIFNALLLAIILILLFIIMDFSDGEVSRYRGQTSKEGSYLDKIYIFLGHPIIMAGVAIYQIQRDPSLTTIVLGFSCVIFIFAFCMVVDYTKKIIIWAHFEKLISTPDYSDKNFSLRAEETPVNAPIGESSRESGGFGWIYGKLRLASKFLDFPYIFLILSLIILLEAILPITQIGEFTPIMLFVYTFGVFYPLVTVFILIKNVTKKTITHQYLALIRRMRD